MNHTHILTGIKATGQLHLGNYIGAIRPFLKHAKKDNVTSHLFIADSHGLTSKPSSKVLQNSIYHLGACLLACGLDTEKTVFYCQSDIPELFELSWILSCITPKGLLNKAHSYKAKRDANLIAGKKDLDSGINMGLFSYPVLMASDILLFSPDYVPVGKDQLQHVEITRDIAQKLNQILGQKLLSLPKVSLGEEDILPGIDGKKMSKSYSNHIPLFLESTKLQKLVRKIKTDSTPENIPKNTDNCLIFTMYKFFASPEEIQNLKEHYTKGISWSKAKDILGEKLEDYFKDKKKIYDHHINQQTELKRIFKQGALKARATAKHTLQKIKKHLGFLALL